MRIFFRKVFENLFFSCRNRAFLIFKDKMMASNDCFSSVYSCRNTMCHDIFNFWVHFFMCQATFFRSVHNRFRHRMREVFFHAGRQSQQIFFGVAVERYYICNCRLRFCQRTRLIKYDCISLCHCFHELAAFYRDMMRICLADCCKYRNRHGKFQCTWEVNH